jgi:uncharacterized protein with HEPN domain
MLDKKDVGFVLAMLKMCDDLSSYETEYGSIDNLLHKRSGINAALMNISQIGEYAGRLGDDFRSKHNSIDWKHVRGLRNIVVHDYFGVDLEKIKEIVKTDIPMLTRALLKIIAAYSSSGDIERGLIDAVNSDMSVIKIP